MGGCIPVVEVVPRYEITSLELEAYIYYMQDHVVIGKIMGIWPIEKDVSA